MWAIRNCVQDGYPKCLCLNKQQHVAHHNARQKLLKHFKNKVEFFSHLVTEIIHGFPTQH